jgi:hypothetical protein
MTNRRRMSEKPVGGHARPARVVGRGAAEKTDGDTHPLLRFQRTVGNRAVVAALGQAKLEVGRTDDPLEVEADEVAARVVQRLSTSSDRLSPWDAGSARRAEKGLARTIQRRAYITDGAGALYLGSHPGPASPGTILSGGEVHDHSVNSANVQDFNAPIKSYGANATFGGTSTHYHY